MDLTQANDYFAHHLDADFWSAQSAEKRECALHMAQADIDAAAPAGVTAGSTNLEFAVCEQAVYLIRNHELFAAGRAVTRQSLGSVSESYTLINPAAPLLAPRAAVFLKQAQKECGYSRSVALVRG